MTCSDVYNFEDKPKAMSIDVNKQIFSDFMETCSFIVAEELAMWSKFTQLRGSCLKFPFQC